MGPLIEQLRALSRVLNHPVNKKNKLKAVCKILWWKVNQRFFHLPAIVKINDRVNCICYPISSYGGLIIYTNLPEYPEMILLEKILKPRSIFFDVGANIGAFSMIAGSKIRNGEIYSFEPIPSVLNILYQNISLNNFQNKIRVEEKVVSDKNGTEKFVIQDIPEYSHISYSDTYKDVNKGTIIESVKLDDFCAKEKVNFIDVMKIDIEGAEMKALRGLEGFIKKRKIGVFIIELCAHSHLYGSKHQAVIDYLRKFNYLTYVMDNDLRIKEIKIVKDLETYNIIAFPKKELASIKKLLKSV